MKAVFTLTPAESRRLIAKAVAQLEEVQDALKEAYVVINGGTTNGYVAQELAGKTEIRPERFTAGTNSHRLMCVTEASRRDPLPVILEKGKVSDKTTPQVLNEHFHPKTVLIKGANAVDAYGNVGVAIGGFDGGTMGATAGIAISQGLKFVVPVGLEKMVPSVEEAAEAVGAKTFDYTMGADFGMWIIPNAIVITELEAFDILADVDAIHVASGGVGESAGAVVLAVTGEDEDVKKAISLVESIKGEPALPGFKGDCENCRYACKFAGTKKQDLPDWLKD
ncbi:hypothetical protein [Dethiosulfatarculus sandiegensis]|uniref:Uncharacterized protein n=1 Tax=Dethiosulfatarculus sandiegensis TaxID=1429043 RepID=A0A0D2J7M4_9BACT|nr:hypothetical protein [Dethiosulfatarculus sandiegensis]KIX14214.1 hypothetical protein X474_09470 [Dethiosulfatarculus sandiegensis]